MGTRRITANPHANGGLLRRPLEMPDFRDYAVKVDKPGQVEVSSTDVTARRAHVPGGSARSRASRIVPGRCRVSIALCI